MIFVSVTRLRLRSPRYIPGFLWYAVMSLLQAKCAPGCFGARIRKSVGLTFWTLTLWNKETCMKHFRGNGMHRRSMKRLPHWCDEASIVHWEESPIGRPSWQHAAQRMAAEGRLSKVLHPSTSQRAGIVAIT